MSGRPCNPLRTSSWHMREIGAGRCLDAGQAAHDVPAGEPQPAADHEHEPARTRRRQRSAPCDVAVEDRAEDRRGRCGRSQVPSRGSARSSRARWPARASRRSPSRARPAGRLERAGSTGGCPCGSARRGPGRSQVSTKSAIARNASTAPASSSAHGCPVAAARSASSGQSRGVGSSTDTCVQVTSRAWMRARISPISNANARDTGSSGTCVSLDPPVHEHLGIGGDRLRHRDAGRERGLLEAEHVVVPERPVTIEVELLHRERSLVGVEPVHAVGGLALHPGHRSQRRCPDDRDSSDDRDPGSRPEP